MTIRNKKEPMLLFIGDVVLFFVALWLTLLVRYAALPSGHVWELHLTPFTILFSVWVVVYFIAGLYGKHTLLLKSKLPTIILYAQLVNIFIAISFFYFIPSFVITPKLNLFIYLGISLCITLVWRIYGHRLLGFRRREKAILIGSGEEMRELRAEVNHNRAYGLKFVHSVDLDKVTGIDIQSEIVSKIYSEGIGVAVVHFRSDKTEPLLPHLYNLIFSHVRFIDMHRVYEDIFDRVPLSLLQYSWFLENISFSPHFLYDMLKRAMDIVISLLFGLVTLPLYPLIAIAIKAEDKGPIFVFQERVGQNNHPVQLIKFRTMTFNDGGEWGDENYNQVTRIGSFLRRSRLDELPQLWNVLVGDVSLIGPRPEFFDAVKEYERQIPYYSIRHLIKPGLSGWAQIHHEKHPHHAVDVKETKNKLAYDLYYIKNRSFMLDIKIALKTLKIFASRSGL
jgi:exopolysaccharide biosynthesis polyprenyl glycosylphosphotransferase